MEKKGAQTPHGEDSWIRSEVKTGEAGMHNQSLQRTREQRVWDRKQCLRWPKPQLSVVVVPARLGARLNPGRTQAAICTKRLCGDWVLVTPTVPSYYTIFHYKNKASSSKTEPNFRQILTLLGCFTWPRPIQLADCRDSVSSAYGQKNETVGRGTLTRETAGFLCDASWAAEIALRPHSSWYHLEAGGRLEIMLETRLHHYYPGQLFNPMPTTSQKHSATARLLLPSNVLTGKKVSNNFLLITNFPKCCLGCLLGYHSTFLFFLPKPLPFAKNSPKQRFHELPKRDAGSSLSFYSTSLT